MVVVGGGLAGAQAALTLRAHGYDGRVVLIGDEPVAPYERPPLSKEYLRGEIEPAAFAVHPADAYAREGVELRTGTPVEALDARERAVRLADGEVIRGDAVLLATGCRPRRLPVPGADLPGVVHLRTLADADRLRALLDAGGPLVVAGGGWIGCEVAASARRRGVDVTLVERLGTPLEGVLGPEVGAFWARVHREEGVRLITGTGVEAFEGHDGVERVRLAGGRTLPCAAVVVAVGVTPRTELAAAAGLAVDDGIAVDACLRTSAPGVFAAGDVARAWHPGYGRALRVEHWATARHQGAWAAGAMLGRREPYDRLPYFFSDQYDVAMEYTGAHAPDDRLTVRGAPGDRAFTALWQDAGGRLTAAMGVGAPEGLDDWATLIRAAVTVDAERLGDPRVPPEEVAGAGATGGVPGACGLR